MSDPRFSEAIARFVAWLRRQPAGQGDIAQLCAEHPALEDEFRALVSIADLARSLAGSASFHQSLHEVFGEEAQVALAFEEREPRSSDDQGTVVGWAGLPTPRRD